MSGGEARAHHRPQGADRGVPLVARRPADRPPDGGAEARGAAAARERQGRCARRGERGSPGADLDGRRRARTRSRQITTAPYRIGQIEFAPGGEQLIAAASAKPHEDRFNEAIYSRRSAGRPLHADRRRRADRWARWRCRPTARPSPTSARASTARSRTTSACSRSPAARRATSPATTHRSADRPAEMDRRPDALAVSVARGFQTVDRSRRTRRHARSRSTASRQRVRVRAHRQTALSSTSARPPPRRPSSGSRRRARPPAPSRRSTSAGRPGRWSRRSS